MPKRSYAGAFMRRGGRRPFVRRMRPTPAQRGYLRTGGYYGRYRGRYAGRRRGDRGPELKFFDLQITNAAVAVAGAVIAPTNPAAAQASLNGIPQGVTESTRVGRKCVVKSMQFRMRLMLPEVDALATPSPGCVIRIMIILDKQCNGSTVVPSDVLENDGAAVDFLSWNQLSNKSRFRVLYDKYHTLNYQTLASDGAGVVSSADVIRYISFYKKCNLPLEFGGTDGALANIRSNNLILLTAGSTTNGQVAGRWRIRFADN